MKVQRLSRSQLRNGSWVVTEQYFPKPNERVQVVVPHSEVCMHMQVAGTIMAAAFLRPAHLPPRVAQLYLDSGVWFSAPITLGEAGFFSDEERRRKHQRYIYCYRVVGPACERCRGTGTQIDSGLACGLCEGEQVQVRTEEALTNKLVDQAEQRAEDRLADWSEGRVQ